MEKILYRELHLSPEDPKKKEKLLSRINNLYQASVQAMSEDFLLHIPKEYQKIHFQTVRDFTSFMLSTSDEKRKGYKRLVDCAVLKTMLAYEEILPHSSHALSEKQKQAPTLEKLEQYIAGMIGYLMRIPGFIIRSVSPLGDIEFVCNIQK